VICSTIWRFPIGLDFCRSLAAGISPIPGPISTSCFALTTDGLETALRMRVYASAWSDRGRIPLPHYRSDGPNGVPRTPLCAPYGSKAKPLVLRRTAGGFAEEPERVVVSAPEVSGSINHDFVLIAQDRASHLPS
jgi:hypothetical protein